MKRVLIFLPWAFVLAGCEFFPAGTKAAREPDVFIAAEWNVQALFDGKETGDEYNEYLEPEGWNAEKYAARVTAVSQAVSQMLLPDGESASGRSAEAPGIIGFVEIENQGVLDDLARGALSKYGYNWNAFAALPGSPLGLGVLSRFPITDARAHSITAGKGTAPRPVLEVRVEPRGKPLVFLLCHWKSKLGNAGVSTALRQASARVIRRRLKELQDRESETPVIVMGDLNETYENLAAEASGDFLVLSAEKPPRAPALYSPWGRELSGGSYYYRGEWESIDHFLLSAGLFDRSGWEFADCRVLDKAPFTAANGAPNTYIPRAGRGLSDHLPLVLYLRDADGN